MTAARSCIAALITFDGVTELILEGCDVVEPAENVLCCWVVHEHDECVRGGVRIRT